MGSGDITAVRLREDQKTLLRNLKQRTGCTESEVIRDALDLGLSHLLLSSMSFQERREYCERQQQLMLRQATDVADLEAKLLLARDDLAETRSSLKYL